MNARSFTRRQIAPFMGAAGVLGFAAAQSVQAAETGTLDPATVWTSGVHRVDTDRTVAGDVLLAPGATIAIAAGVTLRIMGQFDAPLTHVIHGAGKIDLNHSRTPVAYPEWWGARPGDGDADCLPALQSCLAAHPTVWLCAGDYYIADTLVVDRSFVRLCGTGYHGRQAGEGTRLLVRSGSADVLRAGPARKPPTVNDFTQGIEIRDIELGRTLPVEGTAARDPAGLRAQFVLFCRFEHLSARESAVGFAATGAVRTYFRDCIAFRSQAGAASGGHFRGFQFGGTQGVGLAGANGSVFLIDCNVSIGGNPEVSDSVGLLLEGGFADTFVENFEATSLQTGIRIDGATARIGDMAVAGHSNLHIRNAVVDQCGSVGIEIADTSEHALIDIQDPYVAVAGGGKAAILVTSAKGATTIVGGQLIGRSDTRRTACGIEVSGSSGLDVSGMKVTDFAKPLSLRASKGISISGQVHNPHDSASGAAAELSGCAAISLRLRLSGQANCFAHGVTVVGAKGTTAIDTTLFEQPAIKGANVVVDGNPLDRSAERVRLIGT